MDDFGLRSRTRGEDRSWIMGPKVGDGRAKHVVEKPFEMRANR